MKFRWPIVRDPKPEVAVAKRRAQSWMAFSKDFQAHIDRSRFVDLYRKYSGQRIALRREQAEYDVEVRNVNANANIAIRAIKDAVRSLPIRIVLVEQEEGSSTEYADIDHEANVLIRHPNKKNTMREIVGHNVESLLTDGNAWNTIELKTGPNKTIEIWPRDPREVEGVLSKKDLTGWRVGKWKNESIVYPEKRIVHIREINPLDPIYGYPRHEAVRDEVMLDYLANQFNKKFFENGAALSLMFTPDHNLSEDQHDGLLEAIKEAGTGMDKWFGMFINQFAGKIESPDQKHKDIAFGELLKSNREKIFGAYGLPPFRGGIMEFANYANALAQDADFWNNTVKPVTNVLADCYNKQLVWPHFGEDVELAFDFSGIPALKGSPKDRALVHKIYIDFGVLSQNEVRNELGLESVEGGDEYKRQAKGGRNNPEATKPKSEEKEPEDGTDEKPKPTKTVDPKKDKETEVKPTKKERQDFTAVVTSTLRLHKRIALDALNEFTRDGVFLHKFHNPSTCVAQLLDASALAGRLAEVVTPTIADVIDDRGRDLHLVYGIRGVFEHGDDFDGVYRDFEKLANQYSRDIRLSLTNIIRDADRFDWPYRTIVNKTSALFTRREALRFSERAVAAVLDRVRNTMKLRDVAHFNETLRRDVSPYSKEGN